MNEYILEMVVNNYVYSVVRNQLWFYVLACEKVDAHHKKITFKPIDSMNTINLIRGITSYKGNLVVKEIEDPEDQPSVIIVVENRSEPDGM